jgi:hypothetical protein
MSIHKTAFVLIWLLAAAMASSAQVIDVNPQVRMQATADGKVTAVEVAAHFVTAIRLPEAVNSVAVGDPALFQVEHSEREPELVLVKAITEKSAETNLLISTVHGRQISLLVVSRGSSAVPAKVDFLLQYKPAGSFLVEPEVVPFPLVGQTTPLATAQSVTSAPTSSGDRQPSLLPASLAINTLNGPNSRAEPTASQAQPSSLDELLNRQERAPLPALYGERVEGENVKGHRLRAGISEVIDGGREVVVLFSVVNTSKHAILLMTPQVQLGGKTRKGKIVKHDRWSTAEQLTIADFRLSRRRLGSGERADGVVIFERPPYKQSNETLFLQMAESGAVDRPALAPIGFGISSLRQEGDHGTPRAEN